MAAEPWQSTGAQERIAAEAAGDRADWLDLHGDEGRPSPAEYLDPLDDDELAEAFRYDDPEGTDG